MSNLSASKFEELNAAEFDKLKKHNKDDLLGYILKLRNKLDELESLSLIAKQVNQLQRSHVRSLQYNCRQSIELHGIPESIPDTQVESKCIEILKEIGCKKVSPEGIHACHRLKNKKNVIIRFVNRKDADLALHDRGNLKKMNKGKLNLTDNIYLNENLCRPMQFLVYKARCAYREKKIKSYNFWKGKLSVTIDNINFPISHVEDIIDINLADIDERLDFISDSRKQDKN